LRAHIGGYWDLFGGHFERAGRGALRIRNLHRGDWQHDEASESQKISGPETWAQETWTQETWTQDKLKRTRRLLHQSFLQFKKGFSECQSVSKSQSVSV
jgi:hypothetical protein